jgi:phosphatidylglycerol---prolipoprotein diacylglyceryl transferase
MLTHPQFDPIAVSLGPLAVRWYGLTYVAAFVLFLVLGHIRCKQRADLGFVKNQLDDILLYGVFGVVLGGRLGYVAFYQTSYYLAHPIEIFYVWQGGMSFHGGFLGVLLAMWLWGRNNGKSFLQITDFIAPLVPTGLAAGRMGNFINAELPGRITNPQTWPWAMWFPNIDKLPTARHPSQLYNFLLEGVVLFIIVWLVARRKQPLGVVSATFLLGYGTLRFFAEFARQPDDFLGLLGFGLSMGQWLCMPMIIVGFALLIMFKRRGEAGNKVGI